MELMDFLIVEDDQAAGLGSMHFILYKPGHFAGRDEKDLEVFVEKRLVVEQRPVFAGKVILRGKTD